MLSHTEKVSLIVIAISFKIFLAHCDDNFYSSWDDMGKYDIPTMIDHILNVTKQNKIFYIGHSMGTTGFMVMANERPEYQDKIYLASFLAPVAFVDHMKAPIKYLAPFSNQIGVSILRPSI